MPIDDFFQEDLSNATFFVMLSTAIGPPLLACGLSYFVFNWPARHVIAFVMVYVILVLGIALLGWRKRVFVLPERKLAMAVSLFGYALPFLLLIVWTYFGWPTKYGLAIHLIELWVATLVCAGIRLLSSGVRTSTWFIKGHILLSVVFGTGLLFCLSPGTVYLDGLYAMAHHRSLGSIGGLCMVESPNLIKHPNKDMALERQRGMWVVYGADKDHSVGWVPLKVY